MGAKVKKVKFDDLTGDSVFAFRNYDGEWEIESVSQARGGNSEYFSGKSVVLLEEAVAWPTDPVILVIEARIGERLVGNILAVRKDSTEYIQVCGNEVFDLLDCRTKIYKYESCRVVGWRSVQEVQKALYGTDGPDAKDVLARIERDFDFFQDVHGLDTDDYRRD